MPTLRAQLPGLALGFAAVFGHVAANATPERVLRVPEWAQENRVVAAESGSPLPGKWDNSRTPYLVEPMDACQLDNGIRRVILTGGAQFGKSEVSLNAIAWAICYAPCKMMLLQSAISEIQQYSRNKWEPMIEASPALRKRVHLMKSRASDGSTTSVKKFAGGDIEFGTAGSSKGLQGRTIRLIVAEEVAQYEADEEGNVGVGGDAITAAEGRQETWGQDAKTILVSTPGFAGRCRITAEYQLSDMRRHYTPCVQCGDAFVIDIATLHDHEGRACCLCPSCGYIIEEVDRDAMNANGFWLPTFEHAGESVEQVAKRTANPAPPKIVPADQIDAYAPFSAERGYRFAARDCEGRDRGYHFAQVQSNLSSWQVLLGKKQKFEAGQFDAKEYAQKVLGEPYEEIVDRPDSDKLFDARGIIYPNEGVVPPWAAIVTMFIDVQANRFEWGAWAYGQSGAGCRIAKGIIAKNPSDMSSWRDVSALIETKFSGPNYRARRADYIGIDLGGTATEEVYNFVLGHRALNVLALKGASKDGGFAPAYERGATIKVRWKGVPRGRIVPIITGTHGLKTRIYHGLAQGLEAAREKRLLPRSLHLAFDATKTDFQQLTAEHLKQDDPKKKGVWVLPSGHANEQLDIAVGCLALAIMEGLDLFDEETWSRRYSERMPSLAEVDLHPLERIMHVKEDHTAPAETPAQPAAPVDLTPPPAEGTMKSRAMTDERRAKIAELAKMWGGR